MILRANLGVIQDFLQNKLSTHYIQQYLTKLSPELNRHSIPKKGRIRKQVKEFF